MPNGYRTLIYEVNGNRREVRVLDRTSAAVEPMDLLIMADPGDPMDVGASIPGKVLSVLVEEGVAVLKGQPLAVIEAMKMETTVTAQIEGYVAKIFVHNADDVKSGQLLMKISPHTVS